MLRKDKKDILMRAIARDKEKVNKEGPLVAQASGVERFTAITNLKFLEKEATMIEVNHWIKQLTNYINMGCRSNPPQIGIFMHLGPLMHHSWISALEDKDSETKNLELIAELIREERKLRMPHHQRRI